MNKFFLRKDAALFDYTPNDWKKYTTSEERQALHKANMKLPSSLPASLVVNALTAGPFIPWAVAGVTPSWDLDDVKQMADDKDFKTKATYIPGYFPYKNMKLLAFQLAIQRRVERLAQEAKKNK